MVRMWKFEIYNTRIKFSKYSISFEFQNLNTTLSRGVLFLEITIN